LYRKTLAWNGCFTILKVREAPFDRLIEVMIRFERIVFIALLTALSIPAQTIQSFVGTIAGIKPETGEVEIKPDSGETRSARISSSTILQRIAPGEKDLKKAEPIQMGDVAPGDRVLVSIEPGTNDARRIVVMSAGDINKRNQADQQDWLNRGVSGVVTSKNGNEITLAIKSNGAEKTAAVTVTNKTTYRRYAPDSVKFAEATASKPDEIQIGDQLRARGQKSPDGQKVTAEDIVFGTFLTKAGSVVSVDVAANEIRIKELGTMKPFLVKLKPDTQVKAMPDFGGAFGGALPADAGGRGPAGRGGPPGAFGGAPPDPSQMIERMPLAAIDAVKPGQSIIISSTKGAKPDELTAIVVVANAQMLIQMASMMSGGRGGQSASGRGQAGAEISPGVIGGMGGGGFGFDLSGMVP
jgi:hypothetical protein